SIDCFHNNAGIEGKWTHTAEYDEAMFDQVIAVNVKGVFLGLRHVLPVMLQQKSGAIVNTASVAGLVATPGMPAYVASKHAVIGLTKTAAGEVARSGVGVNAVCPGPVDTRMIHSLERQLNPADPAGEQVQRPAAAAQMLEESGNFGVPPPPVALPGDDVAIGQGLPQRGGGEGRVLVDQAGQAPGGGQIDEYRAVLGGQRGEPR